MTDIYSVIKMAEDSGYTSLTHHIDVNFFKAMIKSDIIKLINTYGHKNCGLRHEELCDEIRKIITDNKRIVFQYMDTRSKAKWSKDWNSQRSIYFNKLFQEEGFINMCFPTKYKNNPILNQLLSKHIQFCKEKDVKRKAVEKNPEYSECVKYNSWIETKKASFTREYLEKVNKFNVQTVDKYFSTKDHPGGHDPRGTYNNSKLNCIQYKQPPTSPQIPVARAPSNTRHSPALPTTQPDDTITGQDTPVKTKGPAASVNVKGSKKDSAPTHHQPPKGIPSTVQAEASPKDSGVPPVMQHSTLATATTSSSSSSFPTVKDTTSSLTITPDSPINLGSFSPSDQLSPSPVTKGQDGAPQATTTSDTLVTTHPIVSVPSTVPAHSSLSQPQDPVLTLPPAVTTGEGPRTPASSSANTIKTTATMTTTTAAADTITIQTVRTIQNPVSSTKQAPSVTISQEPPPSPALSSFKVTAPATDTQQITSSTPTHRAGAKSAAAVLPNSKGSIQTTDNQLSKDTQKAPANPLSTHVTIPYSNVQGTPHHIDQPISPVAVQHPSNVGVVSPPSDKSGALVNTPIVHTKTPSMVDSTVRTNKNDKPSIIPVGIPHLTHIIPTLLVILATVTLLFQLYKYTPFGFVLGRRRKRKKRDLRRTFIIPEKPAYDSPNITVHEWEDPNLGGKTIENDIYIKLLKINRYKQEMQKRKKENKKTLIEVHMEVLEEYRNDEWELHKGDFLEICLRGFINDENDDYSKLPNTELTINNINEKTIEDIQKQEILWNNWIENHRNILEEWKKEEWFHILKNKWRKEQQIYKEKKYKLQENTLNEQDTLSIVSQKEIWIQWISKQANLIDMFIKEDWFKSIIYAQDKEKDNYRINEYNNITITTETQLKNEKTNEEGRSKNIIQKLMVQIHMMVLEECIKEDIIKHKELCLDNFIEDTYNQNNYDEERNMPQYDTDNSKVPEFEEINTSTNK
ncbi:STP1 protein [Plasmodium ovale wallikeri]|uniref:STP1 protein n=1 Tax=Plasmodium ovale wallikeri TaxID=864142 RepID=A0A1A9AKC4_PLAOA|nr:STP1 protein [Plasmodium ovale wallikeri]